MKYLVQFVALGSVIAMLIAGNSLIESGYLGVVIVFGVFLSLVLGFSGADLMDYTVRKNPRLFTSRFISSGIMISLILGLVYTALVVSLYFDDFMRRMP